MRMQVEQERKELKRAKAGVSDAETQWRQLVKNMESWNRIVMNLVCAVWLASSPGGFSRLTKCTHTCSFLSV